MWIRGSRSGKGGLRSARGWILLVSAGLLCAELALSAGAPLWVRVSPSSIDLSNMLRGPTAQHWLGTDRYGRDVLARLVYGGRVSLAVGASSAAVALVVGGLFGLVGGFVGGVTDMLFMRTTDAMLSLPTFFLLLIVAVVFGTSLGTLVVAIGLVSWMPIARIVRGEVLRTRDLEFVVAARAMGASNPRIVLRHVAPHTVSALLVATTLTVANAILLESALSYLGLGVRPPTPSWGNMLSDAMRVFWSNPTIAVAPGLAIFVTALLLTWMSEGFEHTATSYARLR